MALFALATGLRQGNVTGLKWCQLDLGRKTGYVAGEDAKCGEDIHISLSDRAVGRSGPRGRFFFVPVARPAPP